MGLFGFGKKKEPVVEQKKEPDQQNETEKSGIGSFYMENGIWMYNPDAKQKVEPAEPKIKVKITR